MALDNRYRFSVDSSASIITSGLLGEQYIGIEVGADDSLLADGDNIEFTSSALLLEKLIGAFGLNQVSGDKESVDE